MTLLKTNMLSKSYGSISALDEVNLDFDANKMYGLFGRNGAGKTTLLDIISSRIFADRGTVTYAGKNILLHPGAMARQCCYMPEKHYFPPAARVKELLAYAGKTWPEYSLETEKKLCDLYALNANQKYRDLSRGFQSIFRIVLGLAANAPVTIFDEPILGLDAVARDMFYRELIQAFSQHPRMFIISTHLIEESADLFDEAIIIDQGEIIRQEPVESLLANTFYVSGTSGKVDAFLKGRKVYHSEIHNNVKTAVVKGKLEAQKKTLGLRYSPMTIQKLFIHLTSSRNVQE